jgi:hypothetical protein
MLPGDITAYRVRLMTTSDAVERFDKILDSFLFGYVGADGIVSLIPVVGDVVSGLTTFWLLSKASEVKLPFGDRVLIFGLGVADVCVGLFVGFGDVGDLFFRAHAWNAERIRHHIAGQLTQIEIVERQLIKSVPAATHRQTLDQLRDSLFRGGRTKQEVWVRIGLIAAACLALLTYCGYQESLRHERLLACQQRGDWFCSFRS